MKRFLKPVYLPCLLIAVVVALAAAFLGNRHVYWVTSGFSKNSFLVTFPNEPSEEMLLEAVIYAEPLIHDKSETVQAYKKGLQVGAPPLFIKVDDDTAVAIAPYSTDRDLNLRFKDDLIIKGTWLTEPTTRVRISIELVVFIYFLTGLIITTLVIFMIIWLWYFLLSRLRELSRAIQGQ